MSPDTFDRLIDILTRRQDKTKHDAADREFVTDPFWEENCRPVFFYGIAHILKHYSRRTACELAQSNKARLIAELLWTIGWADEFFWLSVWSITGRLHHVPTPREIRGKCDRFFLALAHAEWGSLIREAVDHIAGNSELESQSRDSSTNGDFHVWSVDRNKSLKDALVDRARKRFDTAEEFLKSVTDDRSTGIRNDIRVVIYSGYARLYKHSLDDAFLSDGYYNEAKKLVKDMPEEDFKRKHILKSDSPPLDCSRENSEELTGLQILGGWIEDLLTVKADAAQDTSYPRATPDATPFATSGDRVLHPRSHLPKEPPYDKDATTFPNLDTIDQLVVLLKAHREWLQFVMKEGNEYRERVKRIECVDKQLRSATVCSGSADSSPTGWELFVLRDWGSYTPLLPTRLKESVLQKCEEDQPDSAGALFPLIEASADSGGGGGYFLRLGDCGIVIDPGFDFIKHYFEAGVCPDAITHVVVTQDHYDHAASFGPLLNLLHKVHGERDKHIGEHSRVHYLLSRGVLDQYARFIVDFEYFGRMEPLTDRDGDQDGSNTKRRQHVLSQQPRVELLTTHTEHGDRNGFGKGVGLVFKFGDDLPALGFTSDTGWYSRYTISDNKPPGRGLGDLLQEHSPEVMVLHVGSLKPEELRDSGFYKTHLGARGVFRTIDEVKSCRLALLSEFGEECRDHRVWFADRIDNYFRGPDRNRTEFRCFPSEHGTCIVATEGGLTIRRGSEDAVAYLEAIAEEKKDGRITFAPKRTFCRCDERGEGS